MTRNGSADSAQHNVETSAAHATPTTGRGPARQGQRTVAGAAVVAAVPPAVVVAMSYPAVAAVVAAAVVVGVVARHVGRRTPETTTTRSGPVDAGSDREVRPAD